jgi:hypothetical protein
MKNVSSFPVNNTIPIIDAHRGERGRRGASHVPPQKTLKNCNIKMQ